LPPRVPRFNQHGWYGLYQQSTCLFEGFTADNEALVMAFRCRPAADVPSSRTVSPQEGRLIFSHNTNHDVSLGGLKVRFLARGQIPGQRQVDITPGERRTSAIRLNDCLKVFDFRFHSITCGAERPHNRRRTTVRRKIAERRVCGVRLMREFGADESSDRSG
jgi:hypothetical protein